MSGLEATKRLRGRPETRDIPVIGLSAAALVKDTSRAKDAGFYRYLTKPVKVAELHADARRAARRAEIGTTNYCVRSLADAWRDS